MVNMKVNIDLESLMDMELSFGVMTENILENGKKAKKMVLEFILPLMNNIVMKVNGNMI